MRPALKKYLRILAAVGLIPWGLFGMIYMALAVEVLWYTGTSSTQSSGGLQTQSFFGTSYVMGSAVGKVLSAFETYHYFGSAVNYTGTYRLVVRECASTLITSCGAAHYGQLLSKTVTGQPSRIKWLWGNSTDYLLFREDRGYAIYVELGTMPDLGIRFSGYAYYPPDTECKLYNGNTQTLGRCSANVYVDGLPNYINLTASSGDTVDYSLVLNYPSNLGIMAYTVCAEPVGDGSTVCAEGVNLAGPAYPTSVSASGTISDLTAGTYKVTVEVWEKTAAGWEFYKHESATTATVEGTPDIGSLTGSVGFSFAFPVEGSNFTPDDLRAANVVFRLDRNPLQDGVNWLDIDLTVKRNGTTTCAHSARVGNYTVAPWGVDVGLSLATLDAACLADVVSGDSVQLVADLGYSNLTATASVTVHALDGAATPVYSGEQGAACSGDEWTDKIFCGLYKFATWLFVPSGGTLDAFSRSFDAFTHSFPLSLITSAASAFQTAAATAASNIGTAHWNFPTDLLPTPAWLAQKVQLAYGSWGEGAAAVLIWLAALLEVSYSGKRLLRLDVE